MSGCLLIKTGKGTPVIEIVKAEEKHMPDIGKLWMEFMKYSEDINHIFAPREGTIPVFIEKHLRPAMNSENSQVMVALDGNQVVGYSYSMINEPAADLDKRNKYGYVHDLFITDTYRHQGIGEKMFDEILKWFRSQKIHRVELGVIVGNRPADSFWKKHGFIDYVHTLYKQI